jgi:chemotaxis response regulator CheB
MSTVSARAGTHGLHRCDVDLRDDGTAGPIAIKRRGGVTIVQGPGEARHSGMPQSAIDNAEVDFVLSLSRIGPKLGRLAATIAAIKS